MTSAGAPRALVLGGGLLGGHVARTLAQRGHAVTVASRGFNPWLLDQVHRGGIDVDLVELTIAPTPELVALIDAADVVIFLAGASTPSHADRHLTSSTVDSVVTVLTVLDAMRSTTTRRIVLASSGGTVYGEPRQLPTPESHPLDPISIHGMNYVVAERYADFFARHHGLDVAILRYANVYGPGQIGRRGQGVIATWCRALALGEEIAVFDGLEVRRDFVHADDAAQATVEIALRPGAGGAYNVGSGEAVPLGRVRDLIAQAAGRSLQARAEPPRGLDVSATALDSARLARTTGWTPRISLADGIRQSWEWIHEQLVVLDAPRTDVSSRTD